MLASLSLSIIALLFALAQMTLGALGVYSNYTDTSCVQCDGSTAAKYCTVWVYTVCLEQSALVRQT